MIATSSNIPRLSNNSATLSQLALFLGCVLGIWPAGNPAFCGENLQFGRTSHSVETTAGWDREYFVSTDSTTIVEEADGAAIKPMRALSTHISPQQMDENGNRLLLPPDLAGEQLAAAGVRSTEIDEVRSGPLEHFQWDSSLYCHRPLYFEDVNLERYGLGFGVVQPALSAAHFYGNIAILPGRLLFQPPCECRYTLGHYRPGNCVPYQLHRPNWCIDWEIWRDCVVGSILDGHSPWCANVSHRIGPCACK